MSTISADATVISSFETTKQENCHINGELYKTLVIETDHFTSERIVTVRWTLRVDRRMQYYSGKKLSTKPWFGIQYMVFSPVLFWMLAAELVCPSMLVTFCFCASSTKIGV